MFPIDPVLLCIVIFGSWISYTDIKFGKIKNISVFLLFVSGILINVFVTKSFIHSTEAILINFAISFAVSLFMWGISLWSTGDAKLFSAISVLLPLSSYTNGYIPYFPSFIVLINTFVPVAIFFILYAVFNMKRQFLFAEVRNIFSPKAVFSTLIFIFGFMALSVVFGKFFGININFIFQLLLVFSIMEISKRYNWISLEKFFAVGILIAIISSPSSILSLPFLFNALVFFLFFQALRILISYLDAAYFTEEVKIKDLTPGMFLGEYIIKDDKGYYSKENQSIITYFDFLTNARKRISSKFFGRLGIEEVRKIKDLEKAKKLNFKTVKTSKLFPFAPFMFLGVLITFISQGNFLLHMITLKDYFLFYLRLFFERIWA